MRTALLVIDMLNPYDHEHADLLAEHVEPMAAELARLVDTAHVHSRAEIYDERDRF